MNVCTPSFPGDRESHTFIAYPQPRQLVSRAHCLNNVDVCRLSPQKRTAHRGLVQAPGLPTETLVTNEANMFSLSESLCLFFLITTPPLHQSPSDICFAIPTSMKFLYLLEFRQATQSCGRLESPPCYLITRCSAKSWSKVLTGAGGVTGRRHQDRHDRTG